MNSKVIENKIKMFAENIFGFTIADYQLIKSRQIVGVKYHKKGKALTFENYFLNSSIEAIKFTEVLNVLRDTLSSSVAAYSAKERLVDGMRIFSETNNSFKIDFVGEYDLFYINARLLKKSDSTIDLIIIHEMCHMLVDSGFNINVELRPNEVDSKRGDVIFGFFEHTGDHVCHNINFCALLCAAVRKYNSPSLVNNLWRSLKYNFVGNIETERSNVVSRLKGI